MSRAAGEGGWVIAATFVLAMMLSIVPLPAWGEYLRPAWVPMVLIYWCLALPHRVGVVIGWTAGLLQDVLQDAVLGQHALAYAAIAFLALKLHQRMRVFPLGQQALTVLLLVTLSQLILLWIRGIIGESPDLWLYLLPALSSTFLWPWVFLIMRDVRRRYRVS